MQEIHFSIVNAWFAVVVGGESIEGLYSKDRPWLICTPVEDVTWSDRYVIDGDHAQSMRRITLAVCLLE